MLFDFDGMTGLGNHGWHDRTITSDETSITGNFVQLGDGNTTLDAAGGWNDSQFAFEYWPGSWNTPTDYPEGEGIRLYDLADFSDYTNMSIKFEMYIPSSNPWSSGAMQVIFAGTDLVTYGNGGQISTETQLQDRTTPISKTTNCHVPFTVLGLRLVLITQMTNG